MDSAKDTLAGGLPHSEIPGSTIARISPGLFAACHVLHRLSVPRHPPDALLFALEHHTQQQKPHFLSRENRASPPMRQFSLEDTYRTQSCAPPPRPLRHRLRDAETRTWPRAAGRVRLGHVTTRFFTLSISRSTP